MMLTRLISHVRTALMRLKKAKGSDMMDGIRARLERDLDRLRKERLEIVRRLRKHVDRKRLDSARSSISGL